MLLPLPVAAETQEVAEELPAGTLLAPGLHWVVDGVRVLTATERPPLGHVKTFPTNKKVLTDFLRSSPHESEVLALAALLLAGIFSESSIFEDL